jgi:hypothetical protein
VTSVPHTHFLRGDYELTLEWSRTRYYLDAAAWTALGDRERASTLLKARLAPGDLSSLMTGLMGSLLAILEDRKDEAAAIMRSAGVQREAETLFYLARHFAMLGDRQETVRMLGRARREGFTASYALAHDAVFGWLRECGEFQREIDDSQQVERDARRALERTGVGSRPAMKGH